MHAIFSDSTFRMTMYVSLCTVVWIYEMEQFKLKVGRCFALISNHLGGFDLFVTGRRHFLFSEHSLSFNNVMITPTSARPSARTVELASDLSIHDDRMFSSSRPIR